MSNVLPNADKWIDKICLIKYKKCPCGPLDKTSFICAIIGVLISFVFTIIGVFDRCGFGCKYEIGDDREDWYYGPNILGSDSEDTYDADRTASILRTVMFFLSGIFLIIASILIFIAIVLKKGKAMLRLGCLFLFFHTIVWIIAWFLIFIFATISYDTCKEDFKKFYDDDKAMDLFDEHCDEVKRPAYGSKCEKPCDRPLSWMVFSIIFGPLWFVFDILWLWLFWATYKGGGGGKLFVVPDPNVAQDTNVEGAEKRRQTSTSNVQKTAKQTVGAKNEASKQTMKNGSVKKQQEKKTSSDK